METSPYVQDADMEYYGRYCPGGYHPVHLGDTFKDGRYTVVNKLGYGSYSTVWLVRDEIGDSLASLKILTADASEHSSGSELEVLRRSATGSGEGKRFVLQFIDSFFHQGPNGEHLCVVTEVSGPNLATFLWGYAPEGSDLDCLTPELSRAFVLQIARGVEYLHSCGIVHGDIPLGNVLYHLPILSTMKSSEEVEKYFGAPETLEMRLWKGRNPPFKVPHSPRYVVGLPDYTLFFRQLFDTPSLAELRICDFSESSLHSPDTFPYGTKRKLNCPKVHRAPEVIFDDLASPASDMWALGSTMHQIMTGAGTECDTAMPIPVSIVGGGPGISTDKVLCAMVQVLGKLPERWWSCWEKRAEYFDEEGQGIQGEQGVEYPPKVLGKEIYAPYVGERVKEVFMKALSQILVYEPGERLKAHELVEELSALNSDQD
ncbi:kinase-like domain-containing protein [Coprinopsis sp. MPI-PUGE-AT-0042]|nr:kinase-like domain-containing protein [Coprinopsis sp. MPI-PUGE-AT-0042]